MTSSQTSHWNVAPWSAVDTALADVAQLARHASVSASFQMAEDTLAFLAAVVRYLRPRHILEFGSGSSTRCLAASVMSLPGRCAVTSVDHDPYYLAQARDALHATGYSGAVKFQLAPIVARPYGDKVLPTYYLAPARFASKRPIDLIVVDGPPGTLGGREGALYQAMNLSRAGTLILLDDASRAAEQEALGRWAENFEGALEVKQLPGFQRGLAAAVVHQLVKRECAGTYRIKQALQGAGVTDMRSPFVFIDDNQWTGAELGLPAIPFLEHDQEYWGVPADDAQAIAECERLRKSGVRRVVVAWPAFWWFEQYPGFFEYLESHYRRVVGNKSLRVYDARQDA